MNSSIYPSDFYRKGAVKRKVGYCFVLMAFAPELEHVFETISLTLESEPWNFECKRADDFFGGGHILADILRGIGEAEIVIADLTGRNPNVFYELGVAHMVKRPGEILLLTQDMASVPFDLQAFRCIEYSADGEGAGKLRDDLVKALKEITFPIYRFSIKPRATFEFSHRLLGDLNCLYDFTVFADFLGVDAVKITLQVRRYTAGKEAPELLEKHYLGLSRGKPSKVPGLPWELRLDEAGNESAKLSLIRCSEEWIRKKLAGQPGTSANRAVMLQGEIKSDRRSSSSWISFRAPRNFRKGECLRLKLSGPGTRTRPPKKVVIRFLRDDDDEREPIGIITPDGISVPENGVVESFVPADYPKVRVISVHGGPNPWKRFPFGGRNGSPKLVKAELVGSAR